MTKSFTLHRSKGVRVSPCFQTVGVEGEEKKRLGQEPPVVTSEEWTRPAARSGTAGVAGREERRRRMLEREEERSTGVGVGWERRIELGRGPEKE